MGELAVIGLHGSGSRRLAAELDCRRGYPEQDGSLAPKVQAWLDAGWTIKVPFREIVETMLTNHRTERHGLWMPRDTGPEEGWGRQIRISRTLVDLVESGRAEPVVMRGEETNPDPRRDAYRAGEPDELTQRIMARLKEEPWLLDYYETLGFEFAWRN